MTPNPVRTPEVCDYEGSTYNADFWIGKGRDYEDAVERTALRKLLPAQGRRYVEFGAGFGRLINEAARYDHVVVMDYSRTMLAEAKARLEPNGSTGRYTYVAADLYRLPFAPRSFDVAVMCRVIHHLADAPAALKQIRACIVQSGTFILEFANKRNLKAILRHALRQQNWDPDSLEPIEFVKLNFDFHPDYIRNALTDAGFTLRKQLAVSWLRLNAAKRLLPLGLMTAIDSALQPLGAALPLSPSIFTRNTVAGEPESVVPLVNIFKCPQSGATDLIRDGDSLYSPSAGTRYPIRDGIIDFKLDSADD